MASLIQIELENFRNWVETLFIPSNDGITAIVGDNGQGKTNLLESVFYLCVGSSFRTSAKDVLVNFGSDQAILHGIINVKDRNIELDASISRTQKDRHLVNKKPPAKISDLRNEIPIVSFSPDDLQLVKGPPGNRRTLIDDFLIQTSKSSAVLIDEIDKILRHRSALYKSATFSDQQEIEWSLDVWDEKLAVAGTELIRRRVAALARLEPLAQELYCKLSQKRDSLEISYASSFSGPLKDALLASRKDDLRRQVTSVGPHRDDIEVILGKMPARACASQGEQRTISYVIKAAMCRLLEEVARETPIVLLDDILSELDAIRSKSLLELIPDGQILLSATALPEGVDTVAKVVSVNGGRLDG